MATSAERQRRYRRHVKGDHALCDPKRCGPDAERPVVVVEVPRETRFGPRGQALWSAMESLVPTPAHKVVLEEACRLADRLDRLDAMIEGREHWIRLRSRDEDATEYVVVVDALLAEARQQASTFRGLVAELRAAAPKGAAKPPAKGGGGLGDLSARIAARRRASSS